MGDFRVTIQGHVTVISNDGSNFFVRVDQGRQLTETDAGVFIEATLYQKLSSFVPVCNYVFEAIDLNYQRIAGMIDIDAIEEAVHFFFYSILGTSYFLKRIPRCSILYTESKSTYETINDIQVSNLYNLLSGY